MQFQHVCNSRKQKKKILLEAKIAKNFREGIHLCSKRQAENSLQLVALVRERKHPGTDQGKPPHEMVTFLPHPTTQVSPKACASTGYRAFAHIIPHAQTIGRYKSIPVSPVGVCIFIQPFMPSCHLLHKASFLFVLPLSLPLPCTRSTISSCS